MQPFTPFNDYFHGTMSRHSARDKLEGKPLGTFLVRFERNQYKISRVNSEFQKSNIGIHQSDGQFYVEVHGQKFSSMELLIHNLQRLTTDHRFWIGDPLLKENQGKYYLDNIANEYYRARLDCPKTY